MLAITIFAFIYCKLEVHITETTIHKKIVIAPKDTEKQAMHRKSMGIDFLQHFLRRNLSFLRDVHVR